MKMEMGNMEAKERKPQFLINRESVLFKTSEETSEIFSKSAEEFEKLASVEDARKEQIHLYKDMTKTVLGLDPKKDIENDPFYKVAGIDIDTVAIDKHKLLGPVSPNKSVFSATTLILSQKYFEELPDFEVKRDHGEIHELGGTKNLGEGRTVSVRFFDPLVLDAERDWNILFGFCKINSLNDGKSMVFNQGTIGLAAEPLELIKSSPEAANIERKLKEIMTWFNHDLTAHSTFLPSGSVEKLDNAIVILGNQESLLKDFSSHDTTDPESFKSAFAGELWSLNFHQSIFQEIVAARPAVMRYLRAHLDSYARSVENAVAQIQDKDLAIDTSDYMMRAYAFGFFRLVNPKTFAEDPMFKDLYAKYDILSYLGESEEHARSYTFGEKGLVQENEGKKKYMPHKEVFKRFTDSFGRTESYGRMGDRIIESFTNPEKPLTDQERELYAEFIQITPKKSLMQIINQAIEMDFLTALMVENDVEIAGECLLEPGTTKDNFIEKIEEKLHQKRGRR